MGKNTGGTDSLKRKIIAVKQIYDILPMALGTDAVKFFQASFKKEGWDNVGTVPWQPRKGKIGFGATKKGSSDLTRPTLTKTGALKRSIHISSIRKFAVTIESDLPYSGIHNRGGQGLAFGKHPFTMPKRKYMGDSKSLREKLKTKVRNHFNKAFRA